MAKNLMRLSLSFPLTNVKRINFRERGGASTTRFVGRVRICYIVGVHRSKQKRERSTAAKGHSEMSVPRRVFDSFVIGER
jgi:hypothetical protein